MNLPTLIVGAVVVLVIGAVIRCQIRGRKKGKCSCGCDCGGCGMSCSCHCQN